MHLKLPQCETPDCTAVILVRTLHVSNKAELKLMSIAQHMSANDALQALLCWWV